MTDWKIFQGNSEPSDNINQLPPPPSWRKFMGADDELVEQIEQRWQKFCEGLEHNTSHEQRGKSFRIHTDKNNDRNTVINMVNAALYFNTFAKIKRAFCSRVMFTRLQLKYPQEAHAKYISTTGMLTTTYNKNNFETVE